MNNKDINKHLQDQGTKINKEQLLEQIRKSNDKDFVFTKDEIGKYMIIRIKV